MNRGLAICLVLAFALAACDDMADQARDDPYEAGELFADGKVMQLAPDGTIARDQPAVEQTITDRPALTLDLLERGRDRYRIFCTPCHGTAGDGDGTVPARGFPRPPSFHSDSLRAASAARIVRAITSGYGVMYAYADRVPPADRWAIAAYVQALQLSRNAAVDALPEAARGRLEAQ